MIKVAVIDSGLNELGEMKGKCIGGISFFKNKQGEVLNCNNEIKDFHGHGTNCAKMILNMCGKVHFYVIKIINIDGYTSSELLYLALEHCLHIDVQIICLSLSIIGKERSVLLKEVLGKLRNQEKVICVSVENGKQSSFPADIPTVFGVKGRRYCNQSYYTYDNNIFCFDATPVLVENGENDYSFFCGNSKANATCAGYIAKLLTCNPKMNVDMIRRKMIENASSDFPTLDAQTDDAERYLRELPEVDSELFRRLVFCFNNRKIKKVFQYITPVMSEETGISLGNVIDFLRLTEEILDIKINYLEITFDNIYYLGNFIEFLKEVRDE